MKTGLIIQARMNSSRLPGKVMLRVCSIPLIDILIERIKECKKIDEIIVATTTHKSDDVLVDHLKNKGLKIFRGSEKNVLSRYYEASIKYNINTVIRVTADCPLIDPRLLDNMIDYFVETKPDYLSNRLKPSYPDGLDIEIFLFDILEKAYINAYSSYDKEHVTPYIYNNNFNIENYSNETDYSWLRWTVDETKDIDTIEKIVGNFYPNITFSWKLALAFVKDNLKNFTNHLELNRNEGEQMHPGQKKWRRAKEIILGGTGLYSKRPNLHLPNHWPTYFKKASGYNIWDLENKIYKDFYLMGVGTNVLGYSYKAIDEAVVEGISRGNLSTFSPYEEVELAEKLMSLEKWASKVKFARSGGEANSIAIRLARSLTGKDGVAICGYHGWHDWYLSAMIGKEDSLNDLLLKGLKTQGVPKALEGTVYPFRYNDIDSLEKIISQGTIGSIKMEVMRNISPQNNFLKKVRELATKHNIVLILDECSSAFRECLGGIYKRYDITPDILIYGKTIANGYALTAVLGKKEIMECGEDSFISSTFWTERIGFIAALKTIEVMEDINPFPQIVSNTDYIKDSWIKLANKYGFDIKTNDSNAIANFTFGDDNNLQRKTFITQEMLKRGYLAGNSIYVSLAHDKESIKEYLDNFEKVFGQMSKIKDFNNVLDGPTSEAGFNRLN